MIKKNYRFETNSLHGGYEKVEEFSRSRVVPIYQTTSYTFKDPNHAADLFSLKKPGNIYTRIMNPTSDVLEKRVSLLEGGIGALTVSSGQSAETLTFLTLARNGDEIISSSEIYG